jgi:hypothetical protein
LDFSLVYMARKLRHRPKTFRRVQDSILIFGSPNLSIKREVGIYPTSQILLSVQPISRVLEVQMHRSFFVGKLRQFPRTFIKTICSNYDISNDVLFRQEDKNCHQVKMWPPTQQLVILVFRSRSCSCSLSLYFCNA